jgi:hypothetical protein
MEQFLSDSRQLTIGRRHAINQARFEIARVAWNIDREAAKAIMRRVRTSQPYFLAEKPAATRAYRMLYEIFGFDCAETIASLKRRLTI